MSRVTHDRTELHSGIETDLFELLSAPVGTLPTGTDLHTALQYIQDWISLREGSSALIQLFTVNAVIRVLRSGSFTVNAIKRRNVTGSFTADSVVKKTQSFTFTADAIKLRTSSFSFTVDAVLRIASNDFTANAVIRRTQSASFTSDAIIKRTTSLSFTGDAVIVYGFSVNAVIAPTLTALQWRSYDGSILDTNVLPDPPMIRRYEIEKFR